MTDTALNQLVARASLQDLVADYASVCDWLDWELLDRVFWPEAQFDFGMFKGGLPAYRDFVKALEEPFARRMHMFGLPRVSKTTATAPVSMSATSSSAAPPRRNRGSMTCLWAVTCSMANAATANGALCG